MRHSLVIGSVILLFLCLSRHLACSQSALASAQKTVDLPLVSRSSKPKLSLQNALQIAEAYIVKEHIDASSHWLFEAKFILYGDKASADKDKTPCWHFLWLPDGGVTGDYSIEIIVSMDGKAMRLPSM
jgi:hypothetical protein